MKWKLERTNTPTDQERIKDLENRSQQRDICAQHTHVIADAGTLGPVPAVQ